MTDRDKEKLVQRFHDLIGPELPDADVNDTIAVSWEVGSTSFDDGAIKTYNWLFDRRYCGDAQLLDVTGFASTGEDGRVTFRLTDAACPAPAAFSTAFDGYVSILATPRGDNPRFVTTSHRLIALPDDPAPGFSNEIEITIRAWDQNGDPAPQTSVHWRCVAAVSWSSIG